ncbi:hypothetical protein [Agromyces silvae]|uniref:hypothetical protein n=1 Tax=Agromyces silvae TaxID=3388266 RepID=UPI00280BD96C|nr:hypothetical protein [Agromyces protaetiae]
MVLIAVIVSIVLLAALSVLQLMVAAGLPYGRLVWGGGHRVLPRGLRVGSAISVLVYAAFAWVLLARAGALEGDESTVVVVLTWVLLGYFVVGTMMNLISRSRAERLVMTPTCAALAVATLIVALS